MRDLMKEAIIKFKDVSDFEPINYQDYAYAVNFIKNHLETEFNQSLNIYSPNELDDIDETIELLIKNNSEKITYLGPVYDTNYHADLYKENDTFKVGPHTFNSMFYFEEVGVFYVHAEIFMSHANYPHNFIFAEKDEQLLDFVTYIEEVERDLMMGDINVITDTEDDLVRTKEVITHQIKREDVLLDEHVKRDIFRSIDEFFSEEGTFYKTYNIPYKRGILLYGQPGNGKTTLVKSIAESVDAPVVYWQITEYTASYSIDEVFSLTNKLSPVILIIEDIDSMPIETRSVFLNALDGATSKEGIFLIGTTNYPEKIDPALINRAGRFDRAYEIKQPTEEMRYDYLKKKDVLKFITEEELTDLSSKTKELSIAQLNELYMSIALEWHYDKKVDLDYIVKQLIENHKRTLKQDFELDEFGDPMGF